MSGERNVLDKLSAAHNVLRQKAGYFFAPGIDEADVPCVTPHKQGALRFRRGGSGTSDSVDICINDETNTDVWVPATYQPPTGTIWMWSLGTAPDGWLIADGAAISRTSPLGAKYVAEGMPYGSGNGTTTVNIPNLKGRVVVGLDAGDADWDTLGETRGVKDVTLTAAQSGLPSHSHTYTITSSNTVGRESGNPNTSGPTAQGTTATSTAGPANAAQSHTNIQPSLVMNYIVKE